VRILIVVTLLASGLAHAQTKLRRAPYVPEPVADPSWTRRVDQQQRVLTNQPCRVCFLGDSLTEFWMHTGRATWDAEFTQFKAINLGLAGDRTEHILYRIKRLDFRRANPKLVVLMMGTNNLGMEPSDKPEEVVRAVITAVTMLRTKLPQASVLVLTIPPNGNAPESPLRKRVNQTNDLLSRTAWPERVRLLHVHDAFVDGAGHWGKGLSLDGTHFSAAGYARLAELVSPVVKALTSQRGSPSRGGSCVAMRHQLTSRDPWAEAG
jgi:lysophospholipase L1-like esterase